MNPREPALDAERALADRLAEALREVEWVGWDDSHCPWCSGIDPKHYRDCQRQRALAAHTEARP